ncbi:MAG: squalene synthase HpnC [Dehalococcoidia bacterium]|nr:squalene synthase HpnC [Dehalococcoidia bacterium]
MPGVHNRLSAHESYALCERLTKSHYENFSVASFLLLRERRKHFYAIYAYCRFVDDLGDEFDGDRLGALDYWQDETEACYYGEPSHPYMIALRETVHAFDIPKEPLFSLIDANRMDQSITRYPTYRDLEYYCQHSANPVGHLVLYICGYRDEERQRLSDYTCTALQLANFWQDVSRDFAKGRIYIPLEDMEAFDYTVEELARHEATDGFRRLMRFQVERARHLFEKGLPLVDMVGDRLKLDIALFSRGGMSVLDSIERQNYDVLGKRPVVGKGKKMQLLLSTLLKLKLLNRV